MTGESIHLRPGSPDRQAVQRAASVIAEGGVIVYPTETLYGLGADAENEAALRQIFRLKGREEAKPLLIIADTVETVHPYVRDVTPEARKLMKSFWPGPLTLVFMASSRVSAVLSAGTGTIGIRVPSNEFCRLLVRSCGRPITSTSVNLTGQPPLQSVGLIREAFPSGIDLFVDAGQLPSAVPSTVVDIRGTTPRLLRAGAVAWSEIDRTLREGS